MSDARPMHVVIAGAGVAGLEAALALRSLAVERIAVELVAPETEFTYRPLAVTEPFGVGEVGRFPLARLVEAAGARLTHSAVESVDPERRVAITTEGKELAYDAILLALGARAIESIAGALTFRGPEDAPVLADLMKETREGRVPSIVFALPSGASWTLPLYELALLSAVHLADAGMGDVRLEVITPEPRPLQLFGSAAVDAVTELLGLHGIGLRTNTTVMEVAKGSARLSSGDEIAADRVVALPRIEGPRLVGIPHDANGFIATDMHGRVLDLEHVYAAGDLTDFPVKQGGLATQQADAAAEAIAAAAGAPIDPSPFTPILRGLLLTGLTPRYLRAEPTGTASITDTEPLWWPPAKIVGRHLAPFLASYLHLDESPPRLAAGSVVEVEVELERGAAGSWSPLARTQ